jgi:ABC-type antimicrobial peptide transport system permease subunit
MIFSILFADSIIAQLVSIFGIGEFVSTLSLINIITPVFLIALLFGIFSYISSGKIKKISIINLVKN